MKVFLDMDGVLTDFDKQMELAHGYCLEAVLGQYERQPWDYWDRVGLTAEEFWRPATEQAFWEDMPWTEEGKDILHLTEETFGRENICLLTSSMIPAGASGKIAWIQREIPQYKKQYLIGPSKDFVAREGTLLIDDAEHNLIPFARAGGDIIRVPRRWNDAYMYVLNGNDPLDEVAFDLDYHARQLKNADSLEVLLGY